MTRINVVPVEELENIHLMAEYRELPRIFGLAKNYYQSPKRDDKTIPPAYILGTGHVKFFYNKLLWLSQRQDKIIVELLKRGYQINHVNSSQLLKDCPLDYCNDYIVTDDALALNRARISLRLSEYYQKIKTRDLKKKK